MKIVVVENEELPRESFLRLLRALRYDDVLAFDSVESAIDGLGAVEEPFIVLLDHDFGQGRAEGYALCAWLREEHPLGPLLPIVYLTGRLAPESYIANERTRPFDGPTVYVPKTRADEQIPDLLARFCDQFDRVQRTLDVQAARRALSVLSRGAPDEVDEREP